MVALLSVSISNATSMSALKVARFGMLTLNETSPASVFDTVSVVMSGAAGFSPDESWYVVSFAAVAAGAAGEESAPEAAAGSATTATAIARTRPGRVSGRTSASG